MTFKVPGARGRPVSVKAGDMFWITTSNIQNQTLVKIDRRGKGVVSQGYGFDPESLLTYFELVEC